MPQISRHPSLIDYATMSAPDVDALVAHARELQQHWHDAEAPRLLSGKNLAVLYGAALADGAAALEGAATRLGARVVSLRPGLHAHSDDTEVRRIATMLSRLYDAVDCECMTSELVRRVGAEAGIPVFDGMAAPEHPLALLVGRLDAATPLHTRRGLLIQAALLRALA